MKDVLYFSHESNARNDLKIKAMRKVFKPWGYSLWWIIIETLREQDDFKLPLKDYVYAGLAEDSDIEMPVVKKYIEQCIQDFELLVSDGTYFWSASLNRRMERRQELRRKASFAGKRSAEVRRAVSTDVEQPSTSVEQGKEIKGNEKKVNDSKVNEKKKRVVFKPPTLPEVIEYFKLKNSSEAEARKAFEYYSEANWHDSQGNKVKNWKQKMLGVWINKQTGSATQQKGGYNDSDFK